MSSEIARCKLKYGEDVKASELKCTSLRIAKMCQGTSGSARLAYLLERGFYY